MTQLTGELARAAGHRGPLFARKLPILMGQFDDGDDAGRVVILGAGSTPEMVETCVPGTDATFEVPCGCVTIAPDVAAHLEIVSRYLLQSEWMRENPRVGRRAHVCNPALH